MVDNAASIGAVLYVTVIILTRYVTQAKNVAKASVRLPRPKSFLLSEKSAALALTESKGYLKSFIYKSWPYIPRVRMCCNFLNHAYNDKILVNSPRWRQGSHPRQGRNICAWNQPLREGQYRRRCVKLAPYCFCLHHLRVLTLTVYLAFRQRNAQSANG